MPFEVLLLDNGSSDGTAEWVRRRHPEVRLIESPVNLGFCAGNNRLMEAAEGDAVAFLNNDTRPEPGWLAALVVAAPAGAPGSHPGPVVSPGRHGGPVGGLALVPPARARPEEELALIRALPMFSPLRVTTLERIAQDDRPNYASISTALSRRSRRGSGCGRRWTPRA